ncbi:MAG: secondary thiamine-phosphate synthase enzyme YjbQ [Candidatus Latescibacterota bacterium]
MMTATHSMRIATEKRVSVKNITHLIKQALSDAGMQTGICLVSTPHTTCGLMVNEYETGLVHDIERLADELLRPIAESGGFQHDRMDHNAQAHLTSSILGRSLTVPVRDADLHLGTWQSVFIVECDGPRTRTIDLLFMGE